MTEGGIMYLYSVKQSGSQEWSVIETDENKDERVIARCRERDDAYTIANCLAALDAGDIVVQDRFKHHKKLV
jgi:hypothetical protein